MSLSFLLVVVLLAALVYLVPWPPKLSKLATLGLVTFAIALFWFLYGRR